MGTGFRSEATGSLADRDARRLAYQHELRKGPMTPPYRFEPTDSAAALHARYDLEPGTETGDVVTVAGRLMLRRVQGKLAFGTLQDGSGRIQLFGQAASTPDFEGFGSLSLGDWIGVTGQV